jgi:hypothetical protein
VEVDFAGMQTGMDVLDVQGEKIGSVADILDVHIPEDTEADEAEPAAEVRGYTADLRVPPSQATHQQYLVVVQGGILGVGTRRLYIPCTEVRSGAQGESVTVNRTKEECEELYARRPEVAR